VHDYVGKQKKEKKVNIYLFKTTIPEEEAIEAFLMLWIISIN
jgi:hypothetical protein